MVIEAAKTRSSTDARIAGCTVHSIEDAARAMDGWRLELMQMTPGRINYSLSVLQFGSVQVFRERTDKTLLKRGLSWPGSLVFSLPVNAEGKGWLAGHEVDPQVSLLVDGAMLPEILTPHSIDLIYIAVDRQRLAACASERGHTRLVDTILNTPSLALWHEHDIRLDRIFTSLFEDRAGFAGQVADRGLMEGFVLEQLLKVLTSARKIASVSDTHNKRLIDRARLMLLQDDCEQPTMAEVAHHLGVSRRHLQTCFNLSVGQAAKEFVRAERLNRVRQALCEARRERRAVTIGDVAATWGFWHLSRFAADYRDMFGELPSETLHPAAGSASPAHKLLATSQNG